MALLNFTASASIPGANGTVAHSPLCLLQGPQGFLLEAALYSSMCCLNGLYLDTSIRSASVESRKEP